ncbi:hypothetical protein [Methylobacterium sp. WSM2598]|uniref:hypothetical protein n=1 Tax=Methylobacterium sp. WSM2598 TaxID=398261 RepID=UPI00035EE763|nr:hypothetical protein [Methylobacterium sp. WSM2598]
MADGWAFREKTRGRLRVVAVARSLARSGEHADHTTILEALRADGLSDMAPSWFSDPAFVLQLDRMCTYAHEKAIGAHRADAGRPRPAGQVTNTAALRGASPRGHEATISTDRVPANMPFPDITLHLRCSACGSKQVGVMRG